jgi:hypothetical protein
MVQLIEHSQTMLRLPDKGQGRKSLTALRWGPAHPSIELV